MGLRSYAFVGIIGCACTVGVAAPPTTVPVAGPQAVHEILSSTPPPAELEKRLTDLMKAKPKDAATLEAVGFGYLMIGRYDKARPVLESAVGASGDSPSRDLVFNLGVVDLKQKTNAMRSVNNIGRHLSRPGLPVDEPMQNLLGSLVGVAGQNKPARKAPLFRAAVEAYVAHDAKLQAARSDGFTRWGGGWLSPAEKRDHDRTRRLLQPQIDYASNKYEDALADHKAAKEKAERTKSAAAVSRNPSDKSAARYAAEEFERTGRYAEEKKRELVQLRRQLPQRSWATSHEPTLPLMLARLQNPEAPQEDQANAAAMPEPTVTETPVETAAVDEPPPIEPPRKAPPEKRPVAAAQASERLSPEANSIFDFGEE